MHIADCYFPSGLVSSHVRGATKNLVVYFDNKFDTFIDNLCKYDIEQWSAN